MCHISVNYTLPMNASASATLQVSAAPDSVATCLAGKEARSRHRPRCACVCVCVHVCVCRAGCRGRRNRGTRQPLPVAADHFAVGARSPCFLFGKRVIDWASKPFDSAHRLLLMTTTCPARRPQRRPQAPVSLAVYLLFFFCPFTFSMCFTFRV